MPLSAAAQQTAGEVPPPPQLEKLEEGEAPAITIRTQEQRARINESRAEGGKITLIKVASGGSTYYLKPNDQPGSMLPGDGGGNWLRAPQWELAVFDVIPPVEEQKAEEAAIQTVAPPPPEPAEPAQK